MRVKVVVVGGGVAGLAAVHRLRSLGISTVLLEGSARLGGKIQSVDFAGRRIDEGAEGIVSSAPVAELIDELGLGDATVLASSRGSGIWTRRGVRRLPAGLLGGVPADPWAMARSRLLSVRGLLRAALDLILPARPLADDIALGELIRSRFGGELATAVVAPLIGGVYAGDINRLSARAVAPLVFETAKYNRSLLLGLRKGRRQPRPNGGGLITFQRGAGTLTSALAAAVGDAALTGQIVSRIEQSGDGWFVRTASTKYDCDAVIVTAPAWRAGQMLSTIGETPALLAETAAAGVAVVTLALPRDGLGRLPRLNGFLVPEREGFLVTAVTLLENKWPGVYPRDQSVLVRCSVGQDGDRRWSEMSDEQLVARVQSELKMLLGLRRPALQFHVARWNEALPQHRPGHLQRLSAVRAELGPRCLLAGASYDGVGVANCVAQGRAAADSLAQLFATQETEAVA